MHMQILQREISTAKKLSLFATALKKTDKTEKPQSHQSVKTTAFLFTRHCQSHSSPETAI
jgi:hypothetical protein